YERYGYQGVVDGRAGTPRRKRLRPAVIAELCRLRQERYADFSIRHFWEQATEKHGLQLSYTWTRLVLQAAGLAPKAPARGQYRRRRERRPLVGMLVHLDASTHAWLPGVPPQDLVVALDDADSRILYARFWPQEGTASTFAALRHVLEQYGRFAELYTDRGSHFCHTPRAGGPPALEAETQVQRALKALGIRLILARSPEAREPQRAGVRHDPGPLAARAPRRRHHRLRRREHLPHDHVRARLQSPLHRAAGAARVRVRSAPRRRSPATALRAVPARRRQRQHRSVRPPRPPAARDPRPRALRPLPRARPRIHRRHSRHQLPGAAAGPLRRCGPSPRGAALAWPGGLIQRPHADIFNCQCPGPL